MLRAYKYRIYPNKNQETQINSFFGACRYVYNWGLSFKTKRYKEFTQNVNRFELCTCGVINNNLTLKDRTWTCPSCGVTHDRDILAANNIKSFGLMKLNYTTIEMSRQDMPSSEPMDVLRKQADEVGNKFVKEPTTL